jgi:hypothetical protein
VRGIAGSPTAQQNAHEWAGAASEAIGVALLGARVLSARAMRFRLPIHLALVSAFALARIARADEPRNPAPANDASESPAASVEEVEAPTKLAEGSVKLFDSRTAMGAFELEIGPVWARKKNSDDPFQRGTGELTLGTRTSTPASRHFYMSGLLQTGLRVFNASSAAWSITVHSIAGGLTVGPLEGEVRFGFSTLTVDVFKGQWSAELLSPRAAASIGLHFGPVHVAFDAHSEYLWRWFGPNYLVRGLGIGLRFDTGHPPDPLKNDRPSPMGIPAFGLPGIGP